MNENDENKPEINVFDDVPNYNMGMVPAVRWLGPAIDTQNVPKPINISMTVTARWASVHPMPDMRKTSIDTLNLERLTKLDDIDYAAIEKRILGGCKVRDEWVDAKGPDVWSELAERTGLSRADVKDLSSEYMYAPELRRKCRPTE